MSDWGIYAGDTDKTIYVWLQDSTTGLGKTGLTFASSGIALSYVLPAAARAAITPATQTVTGAHSDGGFVEIDATNIPGLYRLDLPDAAIASGAYSVIGIKITGVKTATVRIPLGVPKANVTQLLGTAWLTPGTAGTPDVNVKLLSGDATAAIQLSLSAGVIISGTVSTAVLSPTTSAFAADDITEATADHYLGRSLIFTSGALLGQATRIAGYSLVSAEGNFAVVALTEAPANNDTFIIV